MQQVNYQETIVIPTLQKKLQELQSTNLVLEVSLMVEQAKVKDIQTYHQRQVSEYESKTLNSTDLKNKLNAASDENAKNLRTIESLQQQFNTVTSELNSIKSNLSRESSVKDSVVGEYNTLKTDFTNLQNELSSIKNNLSREVSVKDSVMNEYNKLKFEYDNLVNQFNNLKNENEKFKTIEQPKKTRKKQEPVEVMLDGETY
jgi:chromosome segregation ATPase